MWHLKHERSLIISKEQQHEEHKLHFSQGSEATLMVTEQSWTGFLSWFASLVPQVKFFCFVLNEYSWWNFSVKKCSCGKSTFPFKNSFKWKPSDNPTVLLIAFLWSFNILVCNVNLCLHSCGLFFPTYWEFYVRN